ncbi:MAG: IclR family transcriptional regulator C-terminal domain-containing protein, partial [bacterium]|nr:IclR family transcriptional regulator C-terminal domain-containing protein [bacterium]
LAGDLTSVNPTATMSAGELQQQLTEARAKGFVITHQETYPGVSGISVPVLTPRAQPLGSIAIAAPSQRMEGPQIEAYAKLLVEVGQRVANRIAGVSAGES